MRTDRRTTGGGSGLLERERPPLAGAFGDRVLSEVSRDGFSHVRGAVAEHERRRLLDEAESARGRFLALPHRVNGVAQRADQLSLRVGDPRHPSLNHLAGTVCRALARWPVASQAPRFAPSEARYMRYAGTGAGLGPHRDGKCYRVVVCVFSLAGSAPFHVYEDHEGALPAADLLVEPGDLVLLRAPGFWGDGDGRRRHAVGPPLEEERISLTLRMVGGT